MIEWDSRLDPGQFPVEASVVTFFDQFPVQTRGGNFQRIGRRNQIFNIEYRSYLFADQLAIVMGNTFRPVDKNSKDRVPACSLKFRLNQLISLAFNDFSDEPPDPVPLDSHAHNNKKVGETPTQSSYLKSIGFT